MKVPLLPMTYIGWQVWHEGLQWSCCNPRNQTGSMMQCTYSFSSLYCQLGLSLKVFKIALLMLSNVPKFHCMCNKVETLQQRNKLFDQLYDGSYILPSNIVCRCTSISLSASVRKQSQYILKPMILIEWVKNLRHTSVIASALRTQGKIF